VPISHLLRDVWDEFLKLDGKLPATLRLLLLRPGALTNEILSGRRASYLPPFKLLFSLAALFLLVFTMTGGPQRELRELTAPSAGAALPPGVLPAEHQREQMATTRVLEWMVGNMNLVAMLLTPVLALVLKAVYRRSGRYFIEHLVFAAHVQAFLFVVALILIPASGQMSDSLEMGIGGVYFLMALKTVYERSWLRALMNGAIVAACYGAAAVVLVSGVWLAMYAFG